MKTLLIIMLQLSCLTLLFAQGNDKLNTSAMEMKTMGIQLIQEQPIADDVLEIYLVYAENYGIEKINITKDFVSQPLHTQSFDAGIKQININTKDWLEGKYIAGFYINNHWYYKEINIIHL